MEPEHVVNTWRKMEPGTREGLVVFGALVQVILAVVLWAIYFRKTPRRHHHYYHRKRSSTSVDSNGTEITDDSLSPKHQKGRSRPRKHSPRNPPLAEPGGPPPIRTDGPPEGLV